MQENSNRLFGIEKAQRDPSLAWTSGNNRKTTLVCYTRAYLFPDEKSCYVFPIQTINTSFSRLLMLICKMLINNFSKRLLWCFLLHVLFILMKYFCRKACGQFYIWTLLYYILFISLCKSAFQVYFNSLCFKIY